MNKKNVYVIGAGLYGCLTAWKIKREFPNKHVNLIEMSDHIMSVFDPITLGNQKFNNGFHGIELPRAKQFYDFLNKELKLNLRVEKNSKKLIIEGSIVDYADQLKNYPNKLQNFYPKKQPFYNSSPANLLDLVSDDYKDILYKVSRRYSDDFESVMHLLLPWFCPADFDIQSLDEGDQFRNKVRAGIVDAYYAWPVSNLFSELQTPFLNTLREIGVDLFLSTNVNFTDQGIELTSKNENHVPINLNDEIVFLCVPPIGILKHVSKEVYSAILSRPRHMYNALVSFDSKLNSVNFTEILCCDSALTGLSRISKPPKKNNNDYMQLELFLDPSEELNECFKEKISKYLNKILPKIGYSNITIIDAKKTRTVYFPSKKTNKMALDLIRSWSKNFKYLKISESFVPINMAKSWIYSDNNLKFFI